MNATQTTNERDEAMKTKTTYRLGRKENGSNAAWTFLAREYSVDALMIQADLDNAMHPGLYEYTIVADGMPW